MATPTVGNFFIRNECWDDLRFPFEGVRLDSSSGRLDYDYFNGAVNFNATARYPNEPISMIAQLPHAWLEGSTIRPHFHWKQQGADLPNWLMAYKIMPNNAASAVETDFTNHIKVAALAPEFTYLGTPMTQISRFPDIDMTGYNMSCLIHIALFRDSANTSGLFAGPDPSGVGELSHDFDIHFQIDSNGSRQEYIK